RVNQAIGRAAAEQQLQLGPCGSRLQFGLANGVLELHLGDLSSKELDFREIAAPHADRVDLHEVLECPQTVPREIQIRFGLENIDERGFYREREGPDSIQQFELCNAVACFRDGDASLTLVPA